MFLWQFMESGFYMAGSPGFSGAHVVKQKAGYFLARKLAPLL
jgi:hypothetical protein